MLKTFLTIQYLCFHGFLGEGKLLDTDSFQDGRDCIGSSWNQAADNRQHCDHISCPRDLHCSARWVKIYEHGADGERLFGDRNDLIHAVNTGASVKIIANNYKYVTSVQNCHIYPSNGHVFAQALFHVGKSGHEFQDNAYWWFVLASTTGHWYMSRYNVGEHISRGDDFAKYSMAWFIRRSCELKPVVRYLKDGAVEYGSLRSAIAAVRNGYDITIADTERGYMFSADNIEIRGSNIAVQSVWHVSQATDSDRIIFQKNAYWWFSIWSTSGIREMSRWTIGKHESRGQTTDEVSAEWFVDSCWRLVYRNDENGDTIEGDLNDLIWAVELGHRVRVVINDLAFEADVVRYFNEFVEAFSMNAVTKSKFDAFEKDVSWNILSISTSGMLREFKIPVGDSNATVVSSAIQVAWFVDTRDWREVLHVADSGRTISGSCENLMRLVRQGADIRYLIPTLDKTGGKAVVQADNIGIREDEKDIDAMNIRYPNLAESPSISQIFTLINLKGNVHVSEYWMGVQRKKHQYDRKVESRWFVSE